MTERALRLASGTLAAAGAAIMAYLLAVRLTGATIACSNGGCESVQHSAYSEILGVPAAALGLAGFVALLAAACMRGARASWAQAMLALTALLFSGYLLVVQIAVIGAICQWCVAADGLTTAIAALSLLRFRAATRQSTTPASSPIRNARPSPGQGGIRARARRT